MDAPGGSSSQPQPKIADYEIFEEAERLYRRLLNIKKDYIRFNITSPSNYIIFYISLLISMNLIKLLFS